MKKYMKDYGFDPIKERSKIVKWIQKWFNENGPGCNAVIGISGGKDSTIVAALLAEALGKDRVYGVMMPQGIQKDISDSKKVIWSLGINSHTINIGPAVYELLKYIPDASAQTKINLPPRLRMSSLYAFSQSHNGRVVNTCNLSEEWVGYSTRWGDSVGDFSPLMNYTVDEVLEIGKTYKELPIDLVVKTPSDGLCGKTDEDNLGFTYAELDKYIRTGEITNKKHKDLIDRKHKANMFKLKPIPRATNKFPVKGE